MKKLTSFLKNSSGNMAMIGALLAVPLVGSVGVAVDYSQFSRQRVLLQSALDASALATAKQTSVTANEDNLRTYAKDFLLANINGKIAEDKIDFSFELVPGDTSVNPPTPTVVKVAAGLTYDTTFSRVLPIYELEAQLGSDISIGNRTVEVALVLDNSGSMGWDTSDGSSTRIQVLKDALIGKEDDVNDKGIVGTVFEAGTLSDLQDPVKFALVPFNGLVNVGNGNQNANWMDKRGWSDIHHENLNWNTYQLESDRKIVATKRNGKVFGYSERNVSDNGNRDWKTRFDLFDDMGITWAGCVEMRKWPYNVTDDQVLTNQGFNAVRDAMASGDGQNTLFVPYFQPDVPDKKYVNKDGGSYDEYNDEDDYDKWGNNYLKDFKMLSTDISSVRTFGNNETIDPATHGLAVRDSNRLAFDPDRKGWSNQWRRHEWLAKYQAKQFHSGYSVDDMNKNKGPNKECIEQDIVPLEKTEANVITEVKAMKARGSTNIQQGLTWGWRALSPGEPFTDGRPREKTDNVKYIIMLTDGENTYYDDGNDSPNKTFYGAWGYGRYSDADGDTFSGDSRISADEEQNRWEGGLETASRPALYATSDIDVTPDDGDEYTELMNVHTLQACGNVKNDGITIYTIAFEVPQDTQTRDMLEACSGSGVKTDGTLVIPEGKFYFDVDGTGLKRAMNEIAAAIADTHIIK